MGLEILKTDSGNPDFIELIRLLDEDLGERYGEIQKQYEKHNRVDYIKNAVVIYKDKVPAACGAFKEYSRDTAEMKRVFVKKEYRQKGLAKLVMKELEELAVSAGYGFAVLETGIRQKEAISLYEKIGYKVIPNYGPYEGNTNSICMRKTL